MRGGSLGDALVFVIVVRYVIFFFVFWLVMLLVFDVLFVTFNVLFCYLCRVVVYAWRLSWSCPGVCDRRSCCPLCLCLCWLCCLFRLYGVLRLKECVVICSVL